MVGPQPYITARSEMLLRGSEGDYPLADMHQVAATRLKVAEEARVSESVAASAKTPQHDLGHQWPRQN